jgi:hypothetical protein
MTNSKRQQRIAASLRDQILDMRLGIIAPAEWARLVDDAESQGVEMDLTVRTRRAALRGVSNAIAAGVTR